MHDEPLTPTEELDGRIIKATAELAELALCAPSTARHSEMEKLHQDIGGVLARLA